MSTRLVLVLKDAVAEGGIVVIEVDKGAAKEDMAVVKEDMAVVKGNTVVAAEDEGVTDDKRRAVVTNHRHTKNITMVT